MTYLFNNITIVTIYNYIVYILYIGTLLYLLRSSYIKFLYCVSYLLKGISYPSQVVQPRILLINNSFDHLHDFSYQQKGGETL